MGKYEWYRLYRDICSVCGPDEAPVDAESRKKKNESRGYADKRNRPDQEHICPVCGTPFRPYTGDQKYCSRKCRIYAGNHSRHPEPVGGISEVIRTFRCLGCGKTVTVTDPADKRKQFCCARCGRDYWSRLAAKKHKGKKRKERIKNEGA